MEGLEQQSVRLSAVNPELRTRTHSAQDVEIRVRGLMHKLIFMMVTSFLFGVSSSGAKDIYVAQIPIGSKSGADCADAQGFDSLKRYAWVAQNTIHLCGTFNMPGGASGVITIGGSGTEGNPITVKFETGAIATAPYWGANGFITANNQNYIVVDGGTNGTITATANGTNLANQYTPTAGIIFSNVSNSEIKNLTITNVYVHSSPSDEVGTQSTWGIQWAGGSNVSIDGNTIHDAYGCIQYAIPASSTSSNINIFNNETYNCNWSINVGGGSNGNVVNGVSIHGNKVHDWGNWDDISSNNHHDGIFVFAEGPGSAYDSVLVYNNLVYGFVQAPITAFINMSTNGGANNFTFNNVLYNTGSGYAANGYLFDYGLGAFNFNNTIVGPGVSNISGNGYITYGTGSTLRNNIISTSYVGITINRGANIFSSDYNNLYNLNSTAHDSGIWFKTMAKWRAATGFDTHSTEGDPLLNAGSSPPYQLNSTSSAAYQKGANLTSYCTMVPPLCNDAAGNARPATGPWDMGAYQYSSGIKSGTGPNPPSGLVTTVITD